MIVLKVGKVSMVTDVDIITTLIPQFILYNFLIEVISVITLMSY